MLIDIVTPDKNIFSGDIASAVFPGTDGSFGVQENHAALVATLKAGKILVVDNANKEQEFEVKGGVVEINHNKIIVLAE
ncbi:MAG: ATP synthase F1 subunit epsilon [Bacteroidetes bacterium]|nr:MAG: ATP synthase F1 subunit epsilon [Bacteroidota bacterium]MBL1144776.1 ATP synthase F1 subunit epsilon [Bacteroidota bacterium]MCB0802059.1 ATP synthase F1 subunit epsilon [Flavobacteriales bacterium]NOG57570.1 ATP synthase F1 subunit epsilon [Bacteroidota bacterium]